MNPLDVVENYVSMYARDVCPGAVLVYGHNVYVVVGNHVVSHAVPSANTKRVLTMIMIMGTGPTLRTDMTFYNDTKISIANFKC